ncbi:unnamed protein product [Vitrella brassicaformis CCMP3155]|uniref:Uncharacterized protein n=1 Tax=Vitrella brassicaformis (strain CCMP3155) TaxID=1169540 RepID=A0A0G4GUN3_VITBC|nr:unnamed protein product [Vitrella brassicaformis CCMP3155]|eukprot:CEM34490.1 unnamed protein product [Vitrella brassicaformis CCMP3155]
MFESFKSDESNLTLEWRCFVGSVKAVTFYGHAHAEMNVAFASGGCIRCFSAATGRELHGPLAFSDHTHVHGLDHHTGGESDSYLLAWGGRRLQLYSLSTPPSPCHRPYHTREWILTTQMLTARSPRQPQASPLTLLVGCAHNTVEQVCVREGTMVSLMSVECRDDSLLYSMGLLVVGCGDDGRVLVAAGTAFSKILLWWFDLDGEDRPGVASERVEVTQELCGHRGVLFRLRFFFDGAVLCSTSDDRTARVWRRVDVHDRQSPYECIGVLEGHTSRVWDVSVVPSAAADAADAHFLPAPFLVATAGEDSTVRLWRSDGTQVASFLGHCGRGVRSVQGHTTRPIVVSGGEDCDVKLWHVDQHMPPRLEDGAKADNPQSDAVASWQIPPDGYTRSSSGQRDVIKSVHMTDHQSALLATQSGRVFILQWTNDAGGPVSARLLLETTTIPTQFTGMDVSGSVLACSCADGSVVVAWLPGGQGSWTAYDRLHAYQRSIYTNKRVDRVFVLTLADHLYPPLILAADFTGDIRLLPHTPALTHDQAPPSTTLAVSPPMSPCPPGAAAINLSPSPATSKTRSCRLMSALVVDASHVMLGDEHGGVHVVWVSVGEGEGEGMLRGRVVVSEERVHGGGKVLGLTREGERVMSCGADGCICEYKWHHDASPPLQRISSYRVSQLNQLHQLIHTTPSTTTTSPDNKSLIVAFRDQDFVLWDLSTSMEVWRVCCGGSRRAFSFLHRGGRMSFAFSRHDTLSVHSVAAARQADPSSSQDENESEREGRSLVPGFHGREVLALKWIDKDMLVTAGEDNAVRLVRVSGSGDDNDDGGGVSSGTVMTSVQTCVMHPAAVRCLDVAKWQDDAHLVISAGARMVMNVFVAQAGRLSHVRKLAVGDIATEPQIPDQRFMAVASHLSPSSRHLTIFAGTSGALLYTTRMALPPSPTHALLQSITSLPSTVLAIKCLSVPIPLADVDKRGVHVVLLIVGTKDGNVSLYDATSSACGDGGGGSQAASASATSAWTDVPCVWERAHERGYKRGGRCVEGSGRGRGGRVKVGEGGLRLVASYRAHQVGTNAVDAAVIESTATCVDLLVCTGSDDQSITSARVRLSRHTQQPHSLQLCDHTDSQAIPTWTLPNAHHSSLRCGVLAPSHCGDDSCNKRHWHYVTVGWDQHVRVWKIGWAAQTQPDSSDGHEALVLTECSHTRTAVQDAAALCVFRDPPTPAAPMVLRVAVGGGGGAIECMGTVIP